ncbi:MAG: hypothetical protein ACTSUV_04490 [Candidatus Ranarchaeia archaeon]
MKKQNLIFYFSIIVSIIGIFLFLFTGFPLFFFFLALPTFSYRSKNTSEEKINEKKFCPNCNYTIKDNTVNYCPNCGIKLEY